MGPSIDPLRGLLFEVVGADSRLVFANVTLCATTSRGGRVQCKIASVMQGFRLLAVSRGSLLGAVLVGTTAGGLVACSGPSPAGSTSTTSAFVLTVKNLDGPLSNILIGGQKVATLNCWDPPVTLTSGDPGLPPLPWSVTILDISRSPVLTTLGMRLESGGGAAETILIRVDRLEIRPELTSADVNPSCPPAPTGEPLY